MDIHFYYGQKLFHHLFVLGYWPHPVQQRSPAPPARCSSYIFIPQWLEQICWESSSPGPLCTCCPRARVTLLAPPRVRSPDNQLSLHGPTQGVRASMCSLSLSTLMGCRTRPASNTCFEYPQTVPEERSLLPSVLLGANPGRIWKKIKITVLVPAPRSPQPKQLIGISARTSKTDGTSGWSRVLSALSYS